MRCARAPPPLLCHGNTSPSQILAAFALAPAAFQKQIYSVSEVEANKASKKVSPRVEYDEEEKLEATVVRRYLSAPSRCVVLQRWWPSPRRHP
jgi:hypothetical protein